MTKDVYVTVSGIHIGQEKDKNELEIINQGTYYMKNGTHYLIYDEIMEGFEKPVKNMIKFREGYLYVSKKGTVNVNMEFEEDKKFQTYYLTPYGDIRMDISPKKIEFQKEEDFMQITVDYRLEANYEFVSDSRICVKVNAAKDGVNLKE